MLGVGGRGGGAAAAPKFGQLRFFGQQEKFGQSQSLKKFARVCACCFLKGFKVENLPPQHYGATTCQKYCTY